LVEGTGRFVGDHATPPPQPATAAGEDGVTLNLVSVPVQQAASTILADILGVKYTIDPKIDGRVTIQTPAPVARSTAIDLFQSALRTN
jgi:general secretion pathway protein D